MFDGDVVCYGKEQEKGDVFYVNVIDPDYDDQNNVVSSYKNTADMQNQTGVFTW